jgi:iron-sulfur cluster assembly protein
MDTLNITLTENALQKMQEISCGQCLRLDIKSTGCSGNSYKMERVDTAPDGDDVMLFDGVTIAIPKTKSWMLIGMVIDYKEDDFSSEFVFNNPNEKGRCGCGESFTV